LAASSFDFAAAAGRLCQQSAALWPIFWQKLHSKRSKELKLKHIQDKFKYLISVSPYFAVRHNFAQ
jgi:hypothetical protein